MERQSASGLEAEREQEQEQTQNGNENSALVEQLRSEIQYLRGELTAQRGNTRRKPFAVTKQTENSGVYCCDKMQRSPVCNKRTACWWPRHLSLRNRTLPFRTYHRKAIRRRVQRRWPRT